MSTRFLVYWPSFTDLQNPINHNSTSHSNMNHTFFNGLLIILILFLVIPCSSQKPTQEIIEESSTNTVTKVIEGVGICDVDQDCNEDTEYCFKSYCICKYGLKPKFELTFDSKIMRRCVEKEEDQDVYATNIYSRIRFGDFCRNESDCLNNLICDSVCKCKLGQIVIREDDYCYDRVALDERCERSIQCPINSFCGSNGGEFRQCKCKEGTVRMGKFCQNLKNNSGTESTPTIDNDYYTALQIYKITMILASCCLGLVLVLFLVCILKKTYCPTTMSDSQIIIDPRTGEPRRRRGRRSSSIEVASIETVFGSGIPFNCRPPYEKPPTYDESQRSMREIIGIPPPAYDSPQESSASTPACLPVSSATMLPPRSESLPPIPLPRTLNPASLSPLEVIPPAQREPYQERMRPTRNVPIHNTNQGIPRHPDPEEGTTNPAYLPDWH